jgi:TPP-dependent 2-oxoacid decarboxylase
MGGYPPKLDVRKKEHREIKKHFKNMFKSLGWTMPCIFCRQSFKQFYKELPIEEYMSGRIQLMFWLYKLRNKVNQKLIGQEKQCYNDEKRRLKKLYHAGSITENEYYRRIADFKKETFITEKSPPFIEVLQKYEAIRAVCSKRAKTCSLPKKK